MKMRTRFSLIDKWLIPSLGLFSAMGLLAGISADAWAQAGIEAAAQLKQAADWAERQKGSGSTMADTHRIFSTSRTVRRVTPAPSATIPSTLKPRPRSGAPGKVSGRVLDRATGQPLAGVAMLLVSTEPEYQVEILDATTDSSGSYRFPKVEPGRWTVGVDPVNLDPSYAPRRPKGVLTLEKRQSVTAEDILLLYAGCISGEVRWPDGHRVTEGDVTVAPLDTTLYAIAAELDEQGRYSFCAAPPGSAMVWLDLHDGRQIGQVSHLAVNDTLHFDFAPDSWEQMKATQLWIQVVTEGGLGVGFAEVVIFGRRPAHGDRSAMVFYRGETADRQGLAEFYVPVGAYDILAMNPREGEWARQSGIQVTPVAPPRLTHDIVVTGTSTAAEREEWSKWMYRRAEWLLYSWGY
jgi:hypothetical protein